MAKRKQNKTITDNLRLVFVLGWTAAVRFYSAEHGFKAQTSDSQDMEEYCRDLVLDKKAGSPLKLLDGYFNRTFLTYRQALLNYARHNDGCTFWNSGMSEIECNCGWLEIENKLKQGEEI